MMKIVTSVVIHNPELSDVEHLVSTYKTAIDHAKNFFEMKNELIFIDNSLQDYYQKIICEITDKYKITYRYICLSTNGGYGHGHNQAIKQSNSDYHIICNPDIKFQVDTLKVAIDYMQNNSNVGLLTPAVFNKNGNRQYLCKHNPTIFHLFLRRFVPNKIKDTFFSNYLAHFEHRNYSYNEKIKNIPFCTGCFMFFRTHILKKLNGFDERFFMYLEDADLSRRSLKIADNVYLPSFKVVHGWNRGSYYNKKLRNAAIKSAIKYWYKWGGIF